MKPKTRILPALFLLWFFLPLPAVFSPDPAPADSIPHLLRMAGEARDRGDFEELERKLRKSHTIRSQVWEENSDIMIRSFTNMARLHYQLWNYDSASYYFTRAENAYEACSDCQVETIGMVYSYMGRLYNRIGKYEEARIAFKRAQYYFNQDAQPSMLNISLLLLRMASNEERNGNYELAKEYYAKAYEYILKTENNNWLLKLYYDGLAFIFKQEGNKVKQIENSEKALALALKDLNNLNSAALHYNNIAISHQKLDQDPLALSYFQKALDIYRKTDAPAGDVANLHESLSDFWAKQKEYTRALEHVRTGLKLLTTEWEPDDLISNPSLEQFDEYFTSMELLDEKSRILAAKARSDGDISLLAEAIHTDLLIIDIIEYLRNTSMSFESHLHVAKLEYNIFNITLDHTAEAFRQTRDPNYSVLAFSISERSKSSVLLATLRELDARKIGGIPDSLLKLEEELSRQLGFYKSLIYEEKQLPEPDSVRIARWENIIFLAHRQHTRLISQFEKEFPRYYRLKYDKAVITPEDLYRLLPKNTAVLQYNITDTVLHTFLVLDKQLFYKTQAIDSAFIRTLTEYLDYFHRFDFSRQSAEGFSRFCLHSEALYGILIRPFKDQLTKRELIIVPDGLLSYLPFETLISRVPGANSPGHYRDLSYLMREYNISYSFSSTLLWEVQEKQKKQQSNKLLAFAPSYSFGEKITDEQLLRSAARYRKNLFPIPGALEEVHAIEELMPSDLFIREEATEKTFRDTSAYYDIVHLAMHTRIDNQNPLYSKLIFTSGEDSIYDGMLNTFEVFGLDLNARMVVLSACSTGEGEYSKGEGVMSLARGFMYAGSPSLVMTMWQVEDKSGNILMRDFYRYLRMGRSKSKALQLAKLNYLEKARPENVHPFFWSSFAVLGDADPLYANRPAALSGAGALVILLIAGYLVSRRRKKRRLRSGS